MTREQQQRTKIKICGLKRPEDITYDFGWAVRVPSFNINYR